RGDRVAKARIELLGHGSSTDHGTPLEHGDFETRRRQIRGTHEPVVSASNDERIAALGAAAPGLTHGSILAPAPAANDIRGSSLASAARSCADRPPPRSRAPSCS